MFPPARVEIWQIETGQGGTANVPPATSVWLPAGQDRSSLLTGVRIIVLERKRSVTDSITGIAGGFFEWGLGTMPGRNPLAEGPI